MRKVKIDVPASTTNIGCGFDCLGLALSLYNTVEVELIEEESIFIEVKGEGEKSIPTTRDNIIIPALKMVFDRVKKKLKGIRIREINRIPLERGLGSSAATRIAGIVAANYLLDANLSARDILKMATLLEGHPDNAAASLFGGLVAVTINEREPAWVKLSVPETLKVVAVIPRIKVPTKKAREILPSKVSLSDAVFNLSRLAILLPSLTAGIWENLSFATQDKLHQPYRSSLIPQMNRVLEAALAAGAKGAFLSGAGSGIAAFVSENKAGDIGKAMQDAFLEKGIESEVFILSVDKKGCKINEER